MNGLAGKIIRYALTLMIVASVASGSLAYTYGVTRERIEKMRLEEQLNAVQEVCGSVAGESSVSPDSKALELAAQKVEIVSAVFKVERSGQVLAYGFLVTPRGYGGPLTMMVGIDSEGKVTGVKVLEHRETPGLGDKVVGSSEFLSQFKGKTPADPVEIKRDIDAVSGATISSKGVTAGVRAALDAFKAVKEGEH